MYVFMANECHKVCWEILEKKLTAYFTHLLLHMKDTKQMKNIMKEIGGSHSSTIFWDVTPYNLALVH
jgi:hypothetical protein